MSVCGHVLASASQDLMGHLTGVRSVTRPYLCLASPVRATSCFSSSRGPEVRGLELSLTVVRHGVGDGGGGGGNIGGGH